MLLIKDGKRPNSSKVQAICNMPSPKIISEVRAFLGATSMTGI